MAIIIDGNEVAASVLRDATVRTARLAGSGVIPGLAVVLVGDDPASATYVNMKERDCEKVGVRSFDHRYPAQITQAELEAVIEIGRAHV